MDNKEREVDIYRDTPVRYLGNNKYDFSHAIHFIYRRILQWNYKV